MDNNVFAGLGKYNVILADPPWEYRDRCHAGERGAAYKYPIMKIADIKALPVQQLAADDCALFLWITMPNLQLGLDTAAAWGFEYKTVAFTWIKLNKKQPTLFWGMGSYTRANAEMVLLATKGKIRRVDAGVHSVVQTKIGKHSEKPDEVRRRIVRLLGDVPRIELFARQVVPGFDCWGNEV